MLKTRWLPEDPPLPEYPRPTMRRERWVNLNGWWDYAIAPRRQTTAPQPTGKIRVPYAIEATLSGVQRALLPEERLWYRRDFASPLTPEEQASGARVLLHFGAVDWQAEVFINGKRAGSHEGGYTPFSFDITEALRTGENGTSNEVVVAVYDPTNTGMQQCGKQVLRPNSIWYTAVSGIWQTVWLEVVPATSIAALKLTPDLDAGALAVEVALRGEARGATVRAVALDGNAAVAEASGATAEPLTLVIPQPHPWSPADPHLYDLRVQLLHEGQVVDTVESTFALRKFSLEPDARGSLRFHLNNQPLFLYGPLDQGYYPDGLYTPASEAAMLFDLEYTKRIGCNMVRKHVKVEPARWYAACDRLGLIVWQDMPNGGKPVSTATTLLALLAGFNQHDDTWMARRGRGEDANRIQFCREMQELVDHLVNVPCIAVWVPFNEGWGQFQARETAAWLKAYDPTRLVDQASGWFDQGGGDFQSLHIYMRKLYHPRPDSQRAFIISEFGGYGCRVPGHVWDETHKFSQRYFEAPAALTEAYITLLKRDLAPLIAQGLAGAIYTQTTDVEIEINGSLTYDRAVEKMDAGTLQRAHETLYAIFAEVVK